MKKLIISCLVSLVLVATITAPAIAETSPIDASVTVTAYASVTIVDEGDPGLSFGELDPGALKQPEDDSPSITITAATENNIDVDIKVSGTNFSDGGDNSFPIGNAYWNTENVPGGAISMTITAEAIETLSAGQSVEIFHWLTIPEAQEAAAYTSTFTYTSD